MNLVGLMPVRNEAWILEYSVRAALQWCDHLVVLLHACTDDSASIIHQFEILYGPERITCLTERDPAWNEMPHRQAMLEAARDRGATHIAIIDADEVLTRDMLPRIRGYVDTIPKSALLYLPGYNLSGPDMYHSNGLWGRRHFATAFADHPSLGWAGDTFHHREPMTHSLLLPWRPVMQHQGGVMHYWGYSELRLRAKHALYKLTERLRWPDKSIVAIDRQYSMWRTRSDAACLNSQEPIWEYRRIPDEWKHGFGGINNYAEVWQEAEVRRLIREHGPERFAGFDLFGVDKERE